VFSVLPFELSVEARKARGAVETKDAPCSQDVVDLVGPVTACAVGAPHERRTMLSEVGVDGARDRGAVVSLGDNKARAVRHARVSRNEYGAKTVGRLCPVLVEAADDPGCRDHDGRALLTSLAFH
jgi:hypothetical protein